MILHYVAVFLVDASLVVALVGLTSIVRPLTFLRIESRRRGVTVAAVGALLVLVGIGLPVSSISIDAPHTALDRFVPTYQFNERHEIRVAAPPDRTFEAIRAVTADEITLFRTLTAIRRFGRSGPESILDAPGSQPILEVATRTTFLMLAQEPDREMLIGTLVIAPPDAPPLDEWTADWFGALSEPGYAKAAMNFVVEPDGTGSRVTTETRVYATDSSTQRSFAAYWRIIYPGSSLIRRMWLRAIDRRSTRGQPPLSATPAAAASR